MLEKYEKQLEFNRFGIISLLLVVVACVGGIAAGSAMDYLPLVMMTVLGCLSVETLILAVQPMKRIIIASIISLGISGISILISLL
jgi:hypothetical protein